MGKRLRFHSPLISEVLWNIQPFKLVDDDSVHLDTVKIIDNC